MAQMLELSDRDLNTTITKMQWLIMNILKEKKKYGKKWMF